MSADARPSGAKWRVAAAALALRVATLVWRGATAVGELGAALRYEGEPTASVVTVRRLEGAFARPFDGSPALDLGGLERAVLFVFDPACAPTAGNMWLTGILNEIRSCKPSRTKPADARINASYWPSSSFRIRVSTLPRRSLITRPSPK